jgi:pyridinium-3,5-biscarboxylic acid mononucleotide synthase
VDEASLQRLIDDVAAGRCRPDDAVAALRRLPFADLGHTKVDHHRTLRQGMAEAVYAPGKTVEQCIEIIGELLSHGDGAVVLSRAPGAVSTAVRAVHNEGLAIGSTVIWRPAPTTSATVAVVTAGTADHVVAEEAAAILFAHGITARRVDDVGVAGLHRLLAALDSITSADVVIVIAGMEGALASVVGGLTAAPVIAVPTSVGYGSSLDGVTALLAMHASCASGVTVVGIDNGFGAACAAVRVLRIQGA